MDKIYNRMLFFQAGENWIGKPNTNPSVENVILWLETQESYTETSLEQNRGRDNWNAFAKDFKDLTEIRLELARLRSLLK